MSHHSSANNYYLLPIALLAITIVMLLGISVFVLTPKIQTNLAVQIQKELIENNIPVEITLSGRDATLRGIVSNEGEKEKAEAITKKICGIRFVDNQLLTDKPENLTQLAKNTSATSVLSSESNIKLEQKMEADSELKIKKQTEQKIEIESEPKAKPEKPTNTGVADTVANTPLSPSSKTLTLPDKEAIPPTTSELLSNPIIDNSTVSASDRLSRMKDAEEKKTEKKSLNQSTIGKRKVLEYDTMLKAMIAYNKQKGRNPSRHLETLDLRFKKDSEEILQQSNATLNELANSLQKSKKSTVLIIVSAANSQLAIERAKVIQTYLGKKGIDVKRIQITGKVGDESVELKEIR